MQLETKSKITSIKTDNIFTKLKQANDQIQTAMAIDQEEQQKYANKFEAQTPRYEIKNKVWLTLKNITTTTENKKLVTKQAKYTILENIKFHKFRFDTPPKIRNVFHVDKLRAASADLLFSQIFDDNHPGPTIIGNENGTHEYDVEKILEKKSGPRLPISGEME